MGNEKKWIVSLIEVDEKKLRTDGFPVGRELSSVPNLLHVAIAGLSPSGSMAFDSLYLLTGTQQKAAVGFLEAHSLPFHQHVVDRGERCTQINCAVHPVNNVVSIHDRRH